MIEAQPAPAEVRTASHRIEPKPTARVLQGVKKNLQPPPDRKAANYTAPANQTEAQKEAGHRTAEGSIRGLVLLMNLDNNQPQFTFDTRAVSGHIDSFTFVGLNDQGDIRALDQTGQEVTISKAKLVTETCNDIQKLDDSAIEAALPGEELEAQRRFIKTVVERQLQNTDPSQVIEIDDKKLLLEAAKAGGVLTSESLAQMAKITGLINSDEEYNAILNQDSQNQDEAASPDSKSSPEEQSTQKTPLTPEQQKLQSILSENPIPSRDQIETALDLMNLPYNSDSVTKHLARLLERENNNKEELERLNKIAPSNDKDSEAVAAKIKRAQQEGQALAREKENLVQASEFMRTYVGEKWDVIEMLDTKGMIDQLPKVLGALRNSNEDTLINELIGPETVQNKDNREKVKKRLESVKQIAIYGGGGLAAMLAIMALFGMKSSEQG